MKYHISSSGKRLPLSMLVAAVALTGAPLLPGQDASPAVPAPLLVPAETKEIETLIAAIMKAGFPDTAKAEVYAGELSVTATFDPAAPPPFPSSQSKMQMTNPDTDRVTHQYQFDGLHFKLPDGTWLISLDYRYKAQPDDQLKLKAATPIKLAELTQTAAREKPFDAEKDAAAWLEAVAPAHKARTVAEMNRLVPILNYLQISLDELAPAVMLLSRAGWNEAPALALSIANQRSRKYWQLRPWTGPEAVFDPTGEYPDSKTEEQAWRKANPLFSPEPPATAFRRAMFRWMRAQITMENPEDAMMPPATAAAISKALVDPQDSQGHGAKIDALLAGMNLAVSPPETAPLAIRLQSWEAREREPRMIVSGKKKGEGEASISTSFVAPAPAYVPEKADLDDLVALLGDERPSRFWDFSGPHPVGDNALRALALLLESDPRKLAGHPTDRPWTATERKASAAAIQKWWKANREKYTKK